MGFDFGLVPQPQTHLVSLPAALKFTVSGVPMSSALVWVLAVVEILAVAPAESEVVTCGSNVVPMATKNDASFGCRFRFDPALVQGREEELRDLVSAKNRQLEEEQQQSSRTDHPQQYFHQLNNKASPKAREMSRLTVQPLRKAKNLAATLSQSLGLQTAMGGDVLVWLNITSPDCPATPKCDHTSLYRTIDGSCNNLLHPAVGMANTAFQRLLRPSYGDGIHEPRRAVDGHPLPNARSLSLALFPDKDVPDERRPLVVMYWGQLVAHDTSLSAFHLIDEDGAEILCCSRDGSYVIETPERRGACYAIPLPEDDPFFPAHGVRCFTMIRTLSAPSLDCKLGPADKMNGVTHFLDLSMVYGSEPSRTLELREMSGGRLKSQLSKDGRIFLPSVRDPPAECDVASSTDTCYQAGDFRVNQNYQLAALQVVLLREHNRLAKELSTLNPTWNDNRLYEEARRLLIAQYQHITYTNYLPSLIGDHFMDLYQLRPNPYDYNYHYDATLNPSTINSFNTAAFRIFHSTIQGEIRFMDQEYCPMSKERFSDGFFKPAKVQDPGLLDGMLRGLAHQPSQTLDTFFTEEITRYLFRTNTSVGLDLETFDIERGRDHGLPCYNSFRYLCNLPVAHSFDTFLDTLGHDGRQRIASLYHHPDDVDLFVGGILERPLPGTMLGPTFHCLVGEQFYRWKYGDRFFYDNGGFPHSFTPAQLTEIRKSSLSRWLCDSGDNITQIQPNIFKSISKRNPLTSCDDARIPRLDLRAWKEI
ncbi:peroxidase-like [Anabrus simplex]|uniref:peroxidase-like n=1 Tax=Anabrus simplex TaxID=316456 RepID=UPI0035A3A1FC